MRIDMDSDAERFVIDDCFFAPRVWDERSKMDYVAWLARMPDDHPAKGNMAPWALKVVE